jgi:DNA-binding GntR family transcriptional regulator
MEQNAIDNTTLAQKIAESMATQIAEGTLKPGQRLLENELTQGFQTSRAPIREALYILEKDGLVERIPRRGVFVKKYTKKEMSDLYDVIYRLEEICIDKVIEKASAGQINQLEEMVMRMEKIAINRSIKNYSKLIDELHLKIFEISSNDVLKEIYQNLIKRVTPLRFMSLSYHTSLDNSIEEYKGMLKGFIQRDRDMARNYLQIKEKRALIVLGRIIAD